MSISKVLLSVSLLLVGFGGFLVVGALAQGASLPPGTYDLEEGQYIFNVPGMGATNTPTPPTATPIPPSPVPPTPVPTVLSAWHPPTTHEHGDPPPRWVLDSPLDPNFTQGSENHNGFKSFHFVGYTCCDSSVGTGVEVYATIHLIGTPNGRLTRYHSYKIWMLDASSNVSYWQGMLDTGDPQTRRFPRSQGDPGGGSRVLCVDSELSVPFEQWYADTYLGGPNIGWNIFQPAYRCILPESRDPMTWVLGPGNHLGLGRSPAEVLWYRGHMEQAGLLDVIYCTSPFVSVTVDCMEPGALENFVYSTFPEGTPDPLKRELIRQDRLYDCPDCQVPN